MHSVMAPAAPREAGPAAQGGQQTRRREQVALCFGVPHTQELGPTAGVKQPFKHDGVPRRAARGAEEDETGRR